MNVLSIFGKWKGGAPAPVSPDDPLDVADSGETEYSPGLVAGVVLQTTPAGDTVLYEPSDLANHLVLRWTYAVPVTRGAEDAPVITIKETTSAGVFVRALFCAAALSKRQKETLASGNKIVMNLDIAARVPWTLNIQEVAP